MPSPETAQPALARWETVAMASRISVQAPDGLPGLSRGVEAVFGAFARVERDCTRFGTASALVRANRRPDRWHRVPPTLLAALLEAFSAYQTTGGLFDPRVHDSLVDLGYDRTFSEVEGGPTRTAGGGSAPLASWHPRFVPAARLVHLGGTRIDLGGIGKGLALREGSDLLRRATGDFLIDAGGDVYAGGGPGTEDGWLVGIESPFGADEPVAVLELRDLAVATSSVRVRQWRAGEEQVHHLIDPRTGAPGGGDMRSVTVVHPDPACAEVWSKSLFLHGPDGIAEGAASEGLAALWVDGQGALAMSEPMRRFLVWVG